MTAGRSAPHRVHGGRARRSLHSGDELWLKSGYPRPVSHTTRRLPTRRREQRQTPGNQSSISRAADSGESEPCTRLSWVTRARSPRMVPGWPSRRDRCRRRSGGTRPRRAGPRRSRPPGAGGDEFQQRTEERLVLVLGVVAARQIVADRLELESRDGQTLRSIRPRISPTRRRCTPSGLINTRVRSVTAHTVLQNGARSFLRALLTR